MNFEEHDERDDLKIWLSQTEVQQLIDTADSTEERIAFALGARCGLRSKEIVNAAPEDLADTEAGWMLRVWETKTTPRETPVPENLATTINTVDDVREEDSSTPVVDVSTRTLRRWVARAGQDLAEETGEELWTYLTMHDLRRTWATSLKGAEVDAMLVCDWGGWSDLETFLDHYRGKFSPEAQRKQRDKVDWL
jgi:integrase